MSIKVINRHTSNVRLDLSDLETGKAYRRDRGAGIIYIMGGASVIRVPTDGGSLSALTFDNVSSGKFVEVDIEIVWSDV